MTICREAALHKLNCSNFMIGWNLSPFIKAFHDILNVLNFAAFLFLESQITGGLPHRPHFLNLVKKNTESYRENYIFCI